MPNSDELNGVASLDLPNLPDGWIYTALGDLLQDNGLSYGIVQPGSEDPEGVPILRVKNVRKGRVLTDDVLRVSKDIEAGYQRTRLNGGEVLLSLVGSVGEVAIAPPIASGWNVARAIAVIRIKDADKSSWVRLCLESGLAQQFMHIWQTTTVQATLNLRDVRRLPIVLPPNEERDAITSIVGALDDKIAANDRIAEIADELIRQRYADESSRANEMTRIDDLGLLVRDQVPAEALSGDDSYIGLEHMPRRKIWLANWESSDIVTSAKTRFRRGDVLFGKLRPYFHKVGIAFVDGVSSTDILVIRAKAESVRGWLLAALSSDEVVAHASAVGDGTRMPRAKWSDLADYRIPRLAEERAVRFNEFVMPLVERVGSSIVENRALAELRDTLLPKLMSGEIRVRDAEKVVEDVT